MPVEKINGQKIDYQIFGDGEPIVFICGMTMNQIPWTIYQKDFFVNEGFKVVVFDNRDTGESGDSTVDSYVTADLASDVTALLNEVDIDSAHIVGYSLGGMIGLELTLQDPSRVKTLTTLGSTAKQLQAEQNLLDVVKSAKTNLSVEDFWKFMGNKVMSWRFFENREAVERWFDFVTSELNRQSPERLYRQADACRYFDVSDRLSEITTPTHVIVGSEDTMLPPHHSEAITKGIFNSKYTVIQNAAHGAYSEAADQFNRVVLDFIRPNT